MTRTRGCILLTAAPGTVRATKATVNRILRATLGLWQEDPFGGYFDRGERSENSKEEISPRWVLSATAQEWAMIIGALDAETNRTGKRLPIDCYHD